MTHCQNRIAAAASPNAASATRTSSILLASPRGRKRATRATAMQQWTSSSILLLLLVCFWYAEAVRILPSRTSHSNHHHKLGTPTETSSPATTASAPLQFRGGGQAFSNLEHGMEDDGNNDNDNGDSSDDDELGLPYEKDSDADTPVAVVNVAGAAHDSTTLQVKETTTPMLNTTATLRPSDAKEGDEDSSSIGLQTILHEGDDEEEVNKIHDDMINNVNLLEEESSEDEATDGGEEYDTDDNEEEIFHDAKQEEEESDDDEDDILNDVEDEDEDEEADEYNDDDDEEEEEWEDLVLAKIDDDNDEKEWDELLAKIGRQRNNLVRMMTRGRRNTKEVVEQQEEEVQPEVTEQENQYEILKEENGEEHIEITLTAKEDKDNVRSPNVNEQKESGIPKKEEDKEQEKHDETDASEDVINEDDDMQQVLESMSENDEQEKEDEDQEEVNDNAGDAEADEEEVDDYDAVMKEVLLSSMKDMRVSASSSSFVDEENDDGGSSSSSSDDSSSEENGEESDADEDKEEREESKKAAATKQQHSIFSNSTKRKLYSAWRRYRIKILVAGLFYSLRHEILQLVVQFMFGERSRTRRGSPLLLKMVLLFALFYTLQQSQRESNGSPDQQQSGASSSSPVLAFALSQIMGVSPVVVLFLQKLFAEVGPGKNNNPAYVPLIEQHYSFEVLNNRYRKDAMSLEKVRQVPSAIMAEVAASAKNTTANHPSLQRNNATNGFSFSWGTMSLPRLLLDSTPTSTTPNVEEEDNVIVLDLTGLGTSLPQLDTIRDKISFLLSEYRQKAMTVGAGSTVSDDDGVSGPTDGNQNTTKEDKTVLPLEVVVVLESQGGSAAEYALAAAQLLRLRREPGITLTICVDKVAASGGYMMACTSSPGCLFAAPFAILGSIGVVGQTLNFYDTLQKYGVEPLTFRSGKAKAPLTAVGEVTREGMAKVQGMLDDVHRSFQRHVAEARPILADRIERVATGDTWLGYDALDQELIDRIITSDEYIRERMQKGARILKLVQIRQPKYGILGAPSVTTTTSAAALSSKLFSLWEHFRVHGAQFLLQLVQILLNDGVDNDSLSSTKPMLQTKL